MFFAAAIQPNGNRNLIAFGMLLKFAYVAVVINEWRHGTIPAIFLIFALCDALWFFALAWAFYIIGRPTPAAPAASAPSAT